MHTHTTQHSPRTHRARGLPEARALDPVGSGAARAAAACGGCAAAPSATAVGVDSLPAPALPPVAETAAGTSPWAAEAAEGAADADGAAAGAAVPRAVCGSVRRPAAGPGCAGGRTAVCTAFSPVNGAGTASPNSEKPLNASDASEASGCESSACAAAVASFTAPAVPFSGVTAVPPSPYPTPTRSGGGGGADAMETPRRRAREARAAWGRPCDTPLVDATAGLCVCVCLKGFQGRAPLCLRRHWEQWRRSRSRFLERC